jgi:hypothetical protein
VNRGPAILICAGLVLATIVAYEPVRYNGFINFDDDVYVTENANIKNGFTKQSTAWAFTTQRASNWHPLTWLSHILDYQFFGLNPLGHHFTSVAIHIINSLLLFYVLKKMTQHYFEKTNGEQNADSYITQKPSEKMLLLPQNSAGLWPSAFVAFLFALHPLHVESVAWVSERKDVLSTFFGFLTILAYVQYTRRPSVLRYTPVVILMTLGLMAKPMLVTLPFVLLLLDYWPLKRPVKLRLLLEKVPLFVLSVVSSVIKYTVQKAGGAVTQAEILPLGERVSNALVSYISYIGKMIYPAGLAVLYPHPQAGLAFWKVVSAAVLLVVITLWTIYDARRRMYLLIGWLWYLGTLVPVIGIVQVGHQAMADRYTYLPAVGIFIMVAWFTAELLGKTRASRIVLTAFSVLILAALLICTRIQIR